MTTFDDREKAFEDKYKKDQELAFRIHARRAKLIGLWAANLMGLTGQDAEAYARQVVETDFQEPGHKDIVRKLLKDFARKGVEMSDHRIEKELEAQFDIARQQILTQ